MSSSYYHSSGVTHPKDWLKLQASGENIHEYTAYVKERIVAVFDVAGKEIVEDCYTDFQEPVRTSLKERVFIRGSRRPIN